MNKISNRFINAVLTLGLVGHALMIKAEESPGTPIKHLEISNDQHEVKANQKEVRDDLAKARIGNQQEELAKKEVALNKEIYDRTRKSYGPKNSLTKEAKERYEQAKTTYVDTCRKNRTAKAGLNQNHEEMQHTQRDLSVDKMSENKN